MKKTVMYLFASILLVACSTQTKIPTTSTPTAPITVTTPPVMTKETPIIDREIFFGNPEISGHNYPQTVNGCPL